MKNPAKTKRIGLSKKIRFEVFKRDKFCCSFCGKSAPDVILEVDHLKPISKGGKNDILNLVTACFDCNRGKELCIYYNNWNQFYKYTSEAMNEQL